MQLVTFDDFRSIVLTAIVMNTFEKLAKSVILKNTEHDYGPTQ